MYGLATCMCGCRNGPTRPARSRYLQLAHNEWDAAAGVSRTKILYSFGREDELDRAAVERLIGALTRLLDPAAATAATAAPGAGAVHRELAADRRHARCWTDCGAGSASTPLLRRRPADERPGERVLFALVANRALAPSSKLAATGWIASDVHIDRTARGQRRRLLPGDGRLLSDRADGRRSRSTTRSPTCSTWRSTCCSSTRPPRTSRPARPTSRSARDEHGGRVDPDDQRRGSSTETGFRTHGKSKDHRDDLPQVVVGMAVTRDGHPGAGVVLARQHRRQRPDPAGQRRHAGLDRCARVIWVADRGFTSARNRRP